MYVWHTYQVGTIEINIIKIVKQIKKIIKKKQEYRQRQMRNI